MKGLGRLVFWEYPRTSWQWDVIVAAILAFIFLTPRSVFRDQPKAANIVMLPSHQGLFFEAPHRHRVARNAGAAPVTVCSAWSASGPFSRTCTVFTFGGASDGPPSRRS